MNGETVEIFNSVLGVYTGDRAAAEVYPIAEASGHSSLHTYPIGIVDHVLDLEGDNGLYTLTDRANIGSGTDGSFSANFIVKDGLITQDLKGGWVAFPSTDGWTIKWYDGKFGPA